jgi:hypothetical protein
MILGGGGCLPVAPSLPVVAKCNKTQKPPGNLPRLSLRSVTNHNGNHGPLTIRAILPLTNIQSQTPDINTPPNEPIRTLRMVQETRP